MMYNAEAYLGQFAPEQWLEATIKAYQRDEIAVIPLEMLRLGFFLNSPDGWREIAPAWMEEFETEGIKPLEEFKIDDNQQEVENE